MFKDSKWIWLNDVSGNDTYVEFYDTFDFSGDKALLYISADSNYAVYVNGVFVNSGQYPDFPHYKVYDELDITDYCTKSKNHLAVVVWYYGKENMGYFPGNAALIYELKADGKTVCCSDKQTLSRKSRTYQNGLEKLITGQLGFSFHYDLTHEDGWMMGELNGFAESKIVAQTLDFYSRPIEKLIIGERHNSKIIKQTGDTHFLFDLGEEEVGYLTLSLSSEKKQKITVCYGEHIVDGCVRRIIGSRDFSMEITVREGNNEYTNPFRRLGLRYLEVFCESPIKIEYMSVLPTYYPLNKLGSKLPENSLRASIYKTAERTLELCMHDHYEDCPWREQALYGMDSRNQMLCGYYAFGEYKFPRSNLYLFSQDRREDNVMSICAPTSIDLTIPSFCLHYIIAVYEYTVYSGDKTLINEIYPKLKSVISVFANRMKDGLVENFTEKCHWNFHEWSDGLDGRPRGEAAAGIYDCALNCLYVMALKRMHELCEMIGIENDYLSDANKITCVIKERFYDKARKLFVNSNKDDKVSQLVNSFAILCGAAGDDAAAVAEVLADDKSGLTPATLSMLCFKYDALLAVDREKYKNYILDEIDAKFKRMLDAGATSFWETEKGESDFHDAGSLCHGWSALPIYYYNILSD